MNNKPKVSVVIPVYNVAPYLPQCLDSVVGQTLRDIEIICVDDGSTDESPAILAEFASQDSRISVLTRANAGPGTARNTGLAKASGEYLIFLDSDDWFEPVFLEKMVSQAENTGADITICKSEEFDTNTGIPRPSDWMLKTEYLPGEVFRPEEVADNIFQFTYGWPWDKLYRTEFVRNHGLTYPALPNSQDLVFVFDSLVLAEKIAVVPSILVHHRINRKTSVSRSDGFVSEDSYHAVIMLQENMRAQGVYGSFERSFLNWAMEFLIWCVAKLEDPEAMRRSFRKLKQQWLPGMRFEDKPRNYYFNNKAYKKYLFAKLSNYSVFSYGVRLYRKAKKHKG